MDVRDLVIFDGDDTLWLVEQLYDDARTQAQSVVRRAGLDGPAWDRRQRLIDVENVEVLGLSPTRFPTSCVEAYRSVAIEASVEPRSEVERDIWAAASSVFERKAPPVPGVEDVLAEMASSSFQVALLTKGDRQIQEQRIADSGLTDFFEVISIVPEKTRKEFSAVLGKVGVVPERSWSVGNSLPSDINPALSLGMSAIWVDAHVWEHERRENAAATGRLFEVASLDEVPSVLLKARHTV